MSTATDVATAAALSGLLALVEEIQQLVSVVKRDEPDECIEFTEKVNAIAEADSTRELVQLAMAAIGAVPVPMAAIPAHQASLHD